MKNLIRKCIDNLIVSSFFRGKKLFDAKDPIEIYNMRNSIRKLDILVCIWALNQKINNLQKGFIK